jgi:hypothetical protein
VPESTTVVLVDGKALRERRIAAGLTPEQLVTDAGLPKGQVQVLEDAGWGPIDPTAARGIIEALVCHFDDLFVVTEEVEA